MEKKKKKKEKKKLYNLNWNYDNKLEIKKIIK